MPYFPEDFNGEPFDTSPQYAVERFSRQIEELLQTMGHPEAKVTDESQFVDFYWNEGSEWEELQDTVKKVYGIDIEVEDHFWEVAEKMYEQE